MEKENTYEYKFDTVKPPKDRVYQDRVMHYYENHSGEPPRELILKLGKKITDRILYKIPWVPKIGKTMTVNDPEYWGLAAMVTVEMAEIARRSKAGGIFCFFVLPTALTVYFIAIAIGANAFWNRGGWIQNRANTLALWCMYAQVFPLFLDDSKFSVLSSVYPEGYTTSMMVQGINPETVGAANPKAQAIISIIVLVANVCILAAIIKRSVEQKKNPYKNEIFTDQKNYKDALLRAAEANRKIA